MIARGGRGQKSGASATDLLLPRLILGEPLTRSLIARLAAGGLVESLPVHRSLNS